MNILDIKPDTKIKINVKKDTFSKTFETTAISTLGNTLLVEEIVNEDGKALSFVTDKLSFELTILNDKNQPIIWKNVQIRHIKWMNKEYHRIAQTEDGKATNRRKAFRLPIGEKSIAQIGLHNKGQEVILKDVSTTGNKGIYTIKVNVYSRLSENKETTNPTGTTIKITII